MPKIIILKDVWALRVNEKETEELLLNKGLVLEGLIFPSRDRYVDSIDIHINGNLLSVRRIPNGYWEEVVELGKRGPRFKYINF